MCPGVRDGRSSRRVVRRIRFFRFRDVAVCSVASPDVLTATLLALGSALGHATWNYILKVCDDRDAAALAGNLIGGVVAIPVLIAVGLPDVDSWKFILGGALVQIFYIYGLASAYTHGDFSLAYPVARGTGALLVALAGTLALGDHLAPLAWAGVAVVAASLLMLVGRGTTIASIRWALFTGLMISGYQLLDAMGTRRSSSGLAYGFAVAIAVSVTVNVTGLIRGKGSAVVRELRKFPVRLAVAGVLMPTAYTLVLIAFRDAPVGYVSVLRESSVLIGALLGWLFLREGLGRYRVASSAVMILGMALLITGG